MVKGCVENKHTQPFYSFCSCNILFRFRKTASDRLFLFRDYMTYLFKKF